MSGPHACQTEIRIMKKAFFLLFLLLFLHEGLAFAETPPAVLLMQKTYGAMKSFETAFEQELLQRESGVVQKKNGTLAFERPMKIDWATSSPAEEHIIVTGKEIWHYIPDEALAYRYDMSMADDSRSFLTVITGNSDIEKHFDIEEAPAVPDDNGLKHFVLFPAEPTMQTVKCSLWIDAATGFIGKAAVVDFYGNVNSVTFKGFRPNAAIDGKRFDFVPPDGTEVEDRREKK